jgi:hypothetical protein
MRGQAYIDHIHVWVKHNKCERIMEVAPSEEAFEVPVDFSLEDHWSRQETSFKQSCREKEYYQTIC